jgi:hypothetical protein
MKRQHSLILTTTLLATLLPAPLTALAGSIELVNNPATGAPGKFAAEEIRREARARGIAIGAAATATRVVLSVEKGAGGAAQSYNIRVQNEGGRRTVTVRGADEAGAMHGPRRPRIISSMRSRAPRR